MSTIVLLVLTVTLLLLALGWVLYAVALRVDRLHRQVLGSRATLEAQLVHRGQAAIDFAATGALDPASAVLLSRAAHDATATGRSSRTAWIRTPRILLASGAGPWSSPICHGSCVRC